MRNKMLTTLCELGDEVEGTYIHSEVTAVEAVTVDVTQGS